MEHDTGDMTPGDERKSSAAGGDARPTGSWSFPHITAFGVGILR
jgi:hypothetical protein